MIILLDEATKEIIIPYSSKAEKLVVYDEDKLVLEYNLSEYVGIDEEKVLIEKVVNWIKNLFS